MAKNKFELNLDVEEEGWLKALPSLQELSEQIVDNVLMISFLISCVFMVSPPF